MPKRRANGEGNIRKRKDGRWEGRYTAGYDPETGKRLIKNVLGKTQAEVKEKLKIAISVLDKDQEKDVLKGLKSASGFLRRELGHSLQLRYTPELQFIADDSIAYGAHILEVLRDPEKVKPVNPDNDAVLPDEED